MASLPTTQHSMVREEEAGGERFMRLGSALLVASKSEAGIWHRIEGGRCDCRGFQYRGACRHLVAAARLVSPEPVPVDPSWQAWLDVNAY